MIAMDRLSSSPDITAYAAFAPVINSLGALLVIWLIAWWLYRQKVFFRI